MTSLSYFNLFTQKFIIFFFFFKMARYLMRKKEREKYELQSRDSWDSPTHTARDSWDTQSHNRDSWDTQHHPRDTWDNRQHHRDSWDHHQQLPHNTRDYWDAPAAGGVAVSGHLKDNWEQPPVQNNPSPARSNMNGDTPRDYGSITSLINNEVGFYSI